jgi:hypothetical protein
MLTHPRDKSVNTARAHVGIYETRIQEAHQWTRLNVTVPTLKLTRRSGNVENSPGEVVDRAPVAKFF